MLIGQNLLEHSSLQKWTLRFKTKRLELHYRIYALPRLRQQARIALVVGALVRRSQHGRPGRLEPLRDDPAVLYHRAVRANVRASANQLRHGSAILEQMIEQGGLMIVGAEYSLETGLVEFFDGAGG